MISHAFSSSSFLALSLSRASSVQVAACTSAKDRGPLLMRCRNPYVKDGMPFGCGQCLPCRINRSRIWSHRILLEAKMHEHNSFLTLTYRDEEVPRLEDGRGILSIVEHQNFMKRLRFQVKEKMGREIRFYGVGEYGDNTWRPHYHYILFNYPKCIYGQSRYNKVITRCCYACDLVRDAWGKGNIMLAECTDASASYTCGYVVKKMTSVDDARLKGLPPEFQKQSTRPHGLGFDAMWDVASVLMEFNLADRQGDVPSSLLHGGKRLMPLGRYLTRELRKMVGRDPNAPAKIYEKIQAELLPLRIAAFEGSRSFKDEIVEANTEAMDRQELQRQIFKRMKVL